MSKSFKSSLKPESSVVIVSFNTEKLTLACLRSLARDPKLPPSQVIVIDNGSKDDSVEKLKKEFPEVDLIQNADNRGFSVASNQGLKIARGELVLFLNSDTEVLPGAVGELTNFIESHPEIGIVAPRLLNPGGSIQSSCFSGLDFASFFWAYSLGQKSRVEKYAPKGSSPVAIEAVMGAALMVRRSDLEKLGGFDEKFFFYFEDLDLCRRIRRLGKQVIYLPAAEVTHYHGASGQTQANFAYVKQSLFYPLKKVLGQWHPATSQEYILESSIRYFGWPQHTLLSLLARFT